ncbi:MAG: hypothetical protein QM831_25590 [Kofleriaceae bacterium]
MKLSAVVLLVACGGQQHVPPRVISVGAPPNSAWTSAEVETAFGEDHWHNSILGGETQIDTGEVRLIVREGGNSRSTEVDQRVFGAAMSSTEWASQRFEIRADRGWIAVSADHGITWVLYDPATFDACRIKGQPEWAKLPPPAQLDRKGCAATSK